LRRKFRENPLQYNGFFFKIGSQSLKAAALSNAGAKPIRDTSGGLGDTRRI
jgi:hypothetical protein